MYECQINLEWKFKNGKFFREVFGKKLILGLSGFPLKILYNSGTV